VLITMLVIAILVAGGLAVKGVMDNASSNDPNVTLSSDPAISLADNTTSSKSTSPHSTYTPSSTDPGATLGRIKLSLTQPDAGAGGSVSFSPGGKVCDSSCTAEFDVGTKVTLKAKAKDGFIFQGWSGSACFDVVPCTLPINSAATWPVQGEFVQGVLVKVTITGVGTIKSKDGKINCSSSCTYTYGAGVPFDLYVESASGTTVTWQTPCVTTGPNCPVVGHPRGSLEVGATVQ
jgi:hypothetical protein